MLSLLAIPGAPPLQGPDTGRVDSMHGQSALVAAFVLPRLSLECVVAVVEAIRTCSSPVTGGAVACGMALVRIVQVCP